MINTAIGTVSKNREKVHQMRRRRSVLGRSGGRYVEEHGGHSAARAVLGGEFEVECKIRELRLYRAG